MSLEAIAREAGLDAECVRLVARWEGCLRKLAGDQYGPYLCPARVATIGIGTTVWPDGRKVTMQDRPITRARCNEVLAFDLGRRYAPAVDRQGIQWAHENQRSACVSFTYNVGTAGFARSTLCYFLKRKEWDKAANEFRKWVTGGGRFLQGLANRRADERKLFLTPGGVSPKAAETAPEAPPVAVPPPPAPIPAPPPPALPESNPGLWQRIRNWWRR